MQIRHPRRSLCQSTRYPKMSEVSSVVGERGSVSVKHQRVHSAFSPAPWYHALKFFFQCFGVSGINIKRLYAV